VSDEQSRSKASRNEIGWYGLFSRGAKDWLRHNEKVREAVKQHLPDIVSDMKLHGGSSQRTVRVPVRFLEHYRFAVRKGKHALGVGQGDAKPGNVLRTGENSVGNAEQENGEGSDSGEGNPQFLIEIKVDDIIDWFWDELNLPNLKAKTGSVKEDEYTREGWNKRGAHARLDRRRTLKEAIKRRAAQNDGPAFSNEDLRFRQLVKHQRPTTQAVVFIVLDVSSSMTEHDRKLAKSFFFLALQGLRRQYGRIESVFIAHTITAWEFSEEEFFQVTAQGGTIASVAFSKVAEIINERFSPANYNIYLFYASDGENFPQDRYQAMECLEKLSDIANFIGYLETSPVGISGPITGTNQVFRHLIEKGHHIGAYPLRVKEDVWEAIRGFFQGQSSTNKDY